MKVIKTPFAGLLILELDVFPDDRGYFCETFHAEKFRELGLPYEFVQDNQSYSLKNVIRGLHYQVAPFEQGKLVRVIKGKIVDVAVDIRKDSATYVQHFKCELSEDNFRLLWIPPGFAHGFGVLSENAIVHYKCTTKYSKEHERGIRWDDTEIGIDWGIDNPFVSEKDKGL
ncbi:MAG: dTDP-4-dehydrorhamnose 3,5-epimerase [Saprospiraceae bacterium]|nr:dTDP-4-dehydrorhamnose 3,5-epimerase [Saprospiraceae bacterium]